jgi:SAM-dependent methyltransferase
MITAPKETKGGAMAFAELKARHSVVWGNGPYERITNTIRDIHALVIERADPKPGERVLDAATGTGAVAILAAKRGADVVGQDIAPVLIETARLRAEEEGVSIVCEVCDAEEMHYDDASFDVVLSTCGVMFAPDHQAVARELARVTKPGGRLALACWQPDTGMHDVFKMMAPFMPPPVPGAGSPFAWGDRDHVQELLGDSFELEFEEHDSPLTLPSGEDYWELFSTSYGPTKTAIEALDSDRREEFHRAWVEFGDARREGDAMVHHREYLLTLGKRR